MTIGKNIIKASLVLGAIFGLAALEAIRTEDAMRANVVDSSESVASKAKEPNTNPFAQGPFWR